MQPGFSISILQQYDVGVENNNFMPVSFAQMKIIIEKQVEQLKMKEQ